MRVSSYVSIKSKHDNKKNNINLVPWTAKR